MDTKDKIVFCVLLLLSVGLLTLIYCVWNKQTELAHDILLCLIGIALGCYCIPYFAGWSGRRERRYIGEGTRVEVLHNFPRTGEGWRWGKGEHWHSYLNHNHTQVGCTLRLQLFSSDGPVSPCIDVIGFCSERCHQHSRVCQSVYRWVASAQKHVNCAIIYK